MRKRGAQHVVAWYLAKPAFDHGSPPDAERLARRRRGVPRDRMPLPPTKSSSARSGPRPARALNGALSTAVPDGRRARRRAAWRGPDAHSRGDGFCRSFAVAAGPSCARQRPGDVTDHMSLGGLQGTRSGTP